MRTGHLKIILIIFWLGLSTQVITAQQPEELRSPHKKLLFSFSLSQDGLPAYSVSYRQTPIILNSTLGVNGWERGLSLSAVSVSKQDTVWRPVYGERSQVRDHYEEMLITVAPAGNRRLRMQIQVRAYNEGI